EYPMNADLNALISYFKDHRPAGRVAAEAARVGVEQAGSPHIVSTFLPLCCKIPTLPGLLAESAFSAGFINPTLRAQSDQIPWARDMVAADPNFLTQPLETMMQRLGLYGVSEIVSMSPRYAAALSALSPNVAEPEASLGAFSVFRLKEFRPMIASTSAKP